VVKEVKVVNLPGIGGSWGMGRRVEVAEAVGTVVEVRL